MRGLTVGTIAVAAGLLALAAGSVRAAGTNVTTCGLAHHGRYEWTVQTILATSEDAHPDVGCAAARKTVAAIDGGKAAADRRESSPASGEAELVYRKWTCTIATGYEGGARSTFMARKVHRQATWVTCSDGVDVGGVDDEIAYSYGFEPEIQPGEG